MIPRPSTALAILATALLGASHAHASLLVLPQFRYTFNGTLRMPIVQYPAGTPVGFEIAGNSANFTGDLPGSGSGGQTTYHDFSGTFFIGGDDFSGFWTVEVRNSFHDPVMGYTSDTFDVALVGDPRIEFFMGFEEFTGDAFLSTDLPILNGSNGTWGYMTLEQVNGSSFGQTSLNTTVIPEPGTSWLLLLPAALAWQRRRPSRSGSTG